jgi:hypothetical protein
VWPELGAWPASFPTRTVRSEADVFCSRRTKPLRARARAGDQLQRGLTDAVLEVLASHAMTMDAQRHVALGARDPRNQLGRILAGGPGLSRHRSAVPRVPVVVVACRDRLRPCSGGRDTAGRALGLPSVAEHPGARITAPRRRTAGTVALTGAGPTTLLAPSTALDQA